MKIKIITSILLLLTITVTFSYGLSRKKQEEETFNKFEADLLTIDDYSTVIDTTQLPKGKSLSLIATKSYEEDDDQEPTLVNYYIAEYDENLTEMWKQKIDTCSIANESENPCGSNNNKKYNNIAYYFNSKTGDEHILVSTWRALYSYSKDDNNLEQISLDDYTFSKITQIHSLEDKGVLLLGQGYRHETIPLGNKGLIIKLDQDLELDWMNFYDSDLGSSYLDAVVIDHHKLYVLGGVTKCVDAPTTPCGGLDKGMIVRYNLYSGNKIWDKTVNSTLYAVNKTEDGNLVAVGTTKTITSISDGKTPFRYASIMKFDSQYGEVIWNQNYFLKKAAQFVFTDVVETADHNFIATGKYTAGFAYNFDANDFIQEFLYDIEGFIHETYRHGILVKYNEDGKLVSDSLLKNTVIHNLSIRKNGTYLMSGDQLDDSFIEHNKNHSFAERKRTQSVGFIHTTDDHKVELDKIPISHYLHPFDQFITNYKDLFIHSVAILIVFGYVVLKDRKQRNR